LFYVVFESSRKFKLIYLSMTQKELIYDDKPGKKL